MTHLFTCYIISLYYIRIKRILEKWQKMSFFYRFNSQKVKQKNGVSQRLRRFDRRFFKKSLAKTPPASIYPICIALKKVKQKKRIVAAASLALIDAFWKSLAKLLFGITPNGSLFLRKKKSNQKKNGVSRRSVVVPWSNGLTAFTGASPPSPR